jgi:two-component sensor histidine kinase
LLKIDQAIPCGLILNELVTNALKYAYPKQSTGEITIYLRQSAAGVVTLRVCDQGVGLPDGFDVRAAKSMGLPIVQILTDQLGGELSVGPAPGASFTIVFPAEAVDAPVMQVVSTRS